MTMWKCSLEPNPSLGDRMQRAIFEEQEDCGLVNLGDSGELTANLSLIAQTKQVQSLYITAKRIISEPQIVHAVLLHNYDLYHGCGHRE